MKTPQVLGFLCAAALLSGCATMPQRTVMATTEYAAKEPIATSLFLSDQAVLGDEAVKRILSSKLELPGKAKLALMKFPDNQGWGARFYGPYYWRNEEYLKLQQAQADTLSKALLASDQIVEVIPLPSLMIPQQMSIPVLREAAVRMQADLLLVFRLAGDTYSQYRLFAKDKAKAYSTCELVLLDIRTGLVPFARVLTRERLELQQSTDLDLAETMRRAEERAAAEALQTAAAELVQFVKSVPRT
jgi:hypothetical protein